MQQLQGADLTQLVLLDVQGLFGGRDLWLTRDGSAICSVVGSPGPGRSGLQETRYTYTVSREDMAALLSVFEARPLTSIETPQRYGVPDEARPIIAARTGDSLVAVAKWANDEQPDFDAIYQALLAVCAMATDGQVVRQGDWNWTWQPDGFPDRAALARMTQPRASR